MGHFVIRVKKELSFFPQLYCLKHLSDMIRANVSKGKCQPKKKKIPSFFKNISYPLYFAKLYYFLSSFLKVKYVTHCCKTGI